MKTIASLALISAALVGSAAYAQDVQTQPVTRAQVLAELQAARDAGQLSYAETDYPPAQAVTSTKSRAEVVAELQAARGAGQLSYLETDYPPVQAVESTETREQVIAELHAAIAHGEDINPGA